MSPPREPAAGRPGKGRRARPARRSGPAARTSSAREAQRAQGLVRLNKLLADHGVASRRHADELIAEGKVTVDGEVVTELGTKVDPDAQAVEIDGVVLRSERLRGRYYALHKPAGVVCTNDPRETRPRAVDLVADRERGRIYTVGRLDEESTGLILLTNDGDFAQRVAHPRHGVPKTYRVKLRGRVDDEALQRIREGVHLSEGRTAGARVVVKRRTRDLTTLSVTLREGKNREIRRVFARVGAKVVDLQRTDIGPLSVRGLRPGRWRALAREEVEAVLAASGPRGSGDSGERPAPSRAPSGRSRKQHRSRPGGRR